VPPALLDNAAGASKTHVCAVARICGELSPIQAISCIGKDHTKVGQIGTFQQIAAHQSPRTTKLYDRTKDEISLDEVERIKF
jgi:hypothetical protein